MRDFYSLTSRATSERRLVSVGPNLTKLGSAKSALCLCRLLFLLSSGFLNIFQIELDEGRHLRWLPICLLGFLWPGKGQMPDFSWLFGFFKHFKRFQKNVPLTFPVSDFPHGSPVGILNGSRSGDSNSAVKFIGRCKDNGRKPGLFYEPRSQPNGLAAEGSGWSHQDCLDSFKFHLFGDRLNRFL